MTEEELTKTIYEITLLRAWVDELQRQASALQAVAEGANATALAVSSLGKEAVFQLGAGAWTRANPFGSILVEAGAGVVVEKKPGEAKKILEERAAQAGAVFAQVQKSISEAVNRIRELSERAEKLKTGIS